MHLDLDSKQSNHKITIACVYVWQISSKTRVNLAIENQAAAVRDYEVKISKLQTPFPSIYFMCLKRNFTIFVVEMRFACVDEPHLYQENDTNT